MNDLNVHIVALHLNLCIIASQQMLWISLETKEIGGLSVGKENFIEWCHCYPPKHILSLSEVVFPATDIIIMFMASKIV